MKESTKETCGRASLMERTQWNFENCGTTNEPWTFVFCGNSQASKSLGTRCRSCLLLFCEGVRGAAGGRRRRRLRFQRALRLGRPVAGRVARGARQPGRPVLPADAPQRPPPLRQRPLRRPARPPPGAPPSAFFLFLWIVPFSFLFFFWSIPRFNLVSSGYSKFHWVIAFFGYYCVLPGFTQTLHSFT